MFFFFLLKEILIQGQLLYVEQTVLGVFKNFALYSQCIVVGIILTNLSFHLFKGALKFDWNCL